MTQRKLTDDELQKVMAARHTIRTMCCWLATDRGSEYWGGVTKQLDAMALHATADGKPYVEPEPPIPGGYRLAVAGDEGRDDVEYWNPFESKWQMRVRPGTSFISGDPYIVPADRVPTDEDAKSRPEVMVRDGSEPWHKAALYGVLTDNAYSFLVVSQGTSGRFKYARHLYPGE